MRSRLLAAVAMAVLIAGAGMAQAVEPYLEFVRGLREQQYFDYAILYLDQIATKENTPAEIKQVIPYEKAMALQDGARFARSPEKQVEQYNQALAFLEQFVKENPTHPIAADANSDRAQIILKKAQSEILQLRSPSAPKKQLQTSSRELIAKAREVYQTAFDQHDANLKKFGAFIDQQKEPEQYAARSKTEQSLMTASLNLGICTFEEAHTYEATAAEYKQLLTKAADEFEKMHQKYRTQVGGLHARVWQGKCFEEMNEINKALGIYKEILDHPADTGALSQLKTQTLYFKLICLNSKEKRDYRVVADLAEEWMKKHPNEQLTPIGLSIQYEQALAYEQMGNNPDILLADKETFWKKARTISMNVQKYNSEQKDSALALTQRLQAKLNKDKEEKVNDFATAFSLARQAFLDAVETKKELEEATKKGAVVQPEIVAKLTASLANSLSDAVRYFELAFTLVKTADDKKELPQARYLYAHVNLNLKKYYEAAVLAEFVARTTEKDNPLALDSAYLAMAAFGQAFNESKASNDQKGEDLKMIIRASNFIAERWPSSDKANDAYMMLGQMISVQKKPAESAMWYGKVPESDPKYAQAQLAAGQAYWSAYISAGRMIAAERPNAEQLAAWQKSAQDHLRVGIKKLTDTAPKEASPPELIGAKMTLAQIIINQGQDAEALKLLEGEPHSVVKAVTVADEATRPETGMTSRRFAMETYKLIFRAYIGTQNLDKARETMKTLEKIAGHGGAEGGAEITELYISLGRLLKDELERLKANGETERFEKLMTSFETFLNDMASRKDGQTFGSLSWIGETYFALGESVVSTDAAKANGFYEKGGNAFTEILTRATNDQNFVGAKQLSEVKLRLVKVGRLRKDFPPAEVLMKGIAKENANNLKVQIAAAEMYQDWGLSGQADAPKKLIVAIQGDTKIGGDIWGWSQIAKKLHKSPSFATDEYYKQTFLDAQYNSSFCRLRFAREQPAKDKQKHLEGCRTELVTTSAIVKDMPEEQFQRFNTLYRDVLTDLGQPVTDLPRAVDVPVAAPVIEKKPEPEAPTEVKEGATGTTPDKPPEPPKIDMMTWIIFGACLVAGLGAIVWVLVKGKSKPKPKSFGGTTATGPVSFSGVEGGGPLPPPTFVAPNAKPKPRPAAAPGSATAGAATKPATKPAAKPAAPAAPGAAAAPKPKPKPPSPPASK